MPIFTHLHGPSTLSTFRQKNLLDSLRKSKISVDSIDAYFQYFIWTEADLNPYELNQINQLLNLSGSEASKSKGKYHYYVTPRIGTVSPWSSKATEITKLCNLQILRLERGIEFVIQTSKKLTVDELSTIYAHTHDRMTESILLDSSDLQYQYQILTDQSFKTVDILTEGKAALLHANKNLGLAL